MKKIAINEPCHENWAEFTPTQRGAFCDKCAIDVIDFSNRSPLEIKQILADNAGGHLCGRFKKSQLVQLNEDYTLWENQSAKTFQSKFVYALLLVFGMTLFSCETEEIIMGDVAVIENYDNDIQDQNMENSDIEYNHVKGKVKYDPTEAINCSTQEDEFIKGDTIIMDYDRDPDSLYDDSMIDGGLAISPDFYNYVVDTLKKPVSEESPISNPDVCLPEVSKFDAKLFPNPTPDQASVIVNVYESAYFDIYLYEINGKRTKSIFTGELQPGERKFTIDLSDYANGNYLIVINGDKQKETLKIYKTS